MLTVYNPDGTKAHEYRAFSQDQYYETLCEYTYESKDNRKLERMTEYTLSEPQNEQPAERTLAAVYENEYDLCGNLISKKKFSADGTLVSSETYSYSYDEYGRMLQNDQYIYEYTDCTAKQYALYEKVKGSDFLYY